VTITVDEFADYAKIVASIATIIALVCTIKSLRNNSRSREVDVFSRIYREITEKESEFQEVHRRINESQDKAQAEQDFKNWLNRFFNSMEYIAFLANNGYVPSSLIAFLKPTFNQYFEGIFLTYANTIQKNGKDEFAEMKKFYNIKLPFRS